MKYVVTLLALLAAPAAFALDLVRTGKAETVIVIPASPLPVVKFAAEELQYHVERATGAKLPIVTESDAVSAGGCVYLGACEATSRAGVRTGNLEPNAYLIRIAGGNLYLAGDDSDGPATGTLTNNSTRVGTLFAVYNFLEEQLHVRWLWPGESGEVIPQCTNLIVTNWNSTGKPSFVHARWRDGGVYMGSPNGWSSGKARDAFAREQSKWLRRHRFARGMNLDAAHAFTTWWERCKDSHLEYFNVLPDGSRRPDPTYHRGEPSLVSMCVSEPAFHRAIVEHWQRTRTPQRPFIDASENDTNGRCTCPRCLAWDEPEPELAGAWVDRLERARKAFAAGDQSGEADAGNKGWEKALGSLSDRYAKYFLAVQKEAQKVDSGAVVLGYAYANYVNPPRNTHLNERILIGVVPPMYFPWTDAKRAETRRQWEGWAATGARLMLRPNWMLDGHNLPMIVAHKLGEDFRFYAQHGMIATDFDSLTGQFAAQGPNLYVLARLHDHPDLSVEAVLDEFYSAFGKAAGAVRDYFNYWETLCNDVCEAPVDTHWSYFYRGADAVFTPEAFAQARELISRAQQAAQGIPRDEQRVSFVEKGLRNAELTLAVQAAYRHFEKCGDIATLRVALEILDDFRRAAEGDFIGNLGYLDWAEERTWHRQLIKAPPPPTSSRPPAPASLNLLADGGFEQRGAGAWKQHVAAGKFDLGLDTQVAHTGKASLRLCCMEPSTNSNAKGQHSVWGRWYQAGIPVDPAKTYRFRGWVRTTNDTRGLIAVWVTGDVGGKTLARDLLNTEGEWREINLEHIQPRTGTLSIYLNLTNAPGTVWFDDFELVPESGE